MPMLITFLIGLPVKPVHSPRRTLSENAAIRSRTSWTPPTTSCPSTSSCSSCGARRAVWRTARSSVTLMWAPAEHRLAPALDVRHARDVQQEADRLVGHAVLAVVEEQAGALGGQAGRALGVVGEQVAEVGVLDLARGGPGAPSTRGSRRSGWWSAFALMRCIVDPGSCLTFIRARMPCVPQPASTLAQPSAPRTSSSPRRCRTRRRRGRGRRDRTGSRIQGNVRRWPRLRSTERSSRRRRTSCGSLGVAATSAASSREPCDPCAHEVRSRPSRSRRAPPRSRRTGRGRGPRSTSIAERPDGELERGARAVLGRRRARSRDERGDVAHDEQLARVGIEHDLRAGAQSEQAMTIAAGAWPSRASRSVPRRAPPGSGRRGTGGTRRGAGRGGERGRASRRDAS